MRGTQLGRPPRVLVTKIGFDGHDRGSRIVAAFLRDAGMEVIYTGPWQKIPAVVQMALEEDVDVVGVSSLATDHLIVPKLVTAMREAELGHVAVIVGGIVPEDEEAGLLEAGVARIFHPGVPREEIIRTVLDLTVQARAALDAA
ncbi:MAG: cobalamin-dependent protein [Alphaproteobacteria bacterium]|nr:cobalamin-dependent protein [Alphaproteobacteria bacterium]